MYIKGLVECLLEQDGKLFLIEIKRMMAPLKKVFGLIGKSPLERRTGAVHGR